MKNRGADMLIRTLANAGVRRVFTVSGNHIMPVFDAAVVSGIELIHARHEAAASLPLPEPARRRGPEPPARP